MSPQVAATLAGAVVGGALTFFAQWFRDQRRARQRKHQFAASLRAELTAGLELLEEVGEGLPEEIDEEHPAEAFRYMADEIEEAGGPVPPFSAIAPDGAKFRALESNMDRVGMLEPPLPQELAALNEYMGSLRSNLRSLEVHDFADWVERGIDPARAASIQASKFRRAAKTLETVTDRANAVIERLDSEYA